MKREHIIRMMAGTFILTGAALQHWVHPQWIWLDVFVGANLFQSSITKWCLMDDILKKLEIGS